MVGHILGRFLAERSVPDLLAVARDWQPAVVVRKRFGLRGCIAAEAVGLPASRLTAADWRVTWRVGVVNAPAPAYPTPRGRTARRHYAGLECLQIGV